MTLMNDTMLGVAGRLRAARVLAGMEQAELAESVGVARQTISNWERGVAEPALSHFVLLAEATGQPLDWFAAAVVRPEGLEPPTF